MKAGDSMAKKPKYYAIKKGRQTGIVRTWAECEKATKGYSGAVYRSFEEEGLALEWLRDDGRPAVSRSHLTAEHFEAGVSDGNAESFGVDYEVDYEVYTDGSFSNGQYSWAYVFVRDEEIVYEAADVGKNPEAVAMRNVAGEIAAVLYAVRRAVELGAKIRIHHDYAGIAHWVRGEWRTKNPYTQRYADLMKQHEGIYAFVKVEAHSGNRFNEYVDKKAKEALGLSK